MSTVLSVNLGPSKPFADSDIGKSSIDKRPVAGPVEVRAPGLRATGLGSGLVGDSISDQRHHGGDRQAVYAYPQEDLDEWATELGRELHPGVFGENLTTVGVDVQGALIGEQWRIGADLVLEVTEPRIPCRTFAAWLEQRGWVKRFTKAAKPGAYLRVVRPGALQAGDPIVVISRPQHDVTIEMMFRAMTLESELLPKLLVVDDLDAEMRDAILRRTAS